MITNNGNKEVDRFVKYYIEQGYTDKKHVPEPKIHSGVTQAH